MSSPEVEYIDVATCDVLDCLLDFAHFLNGHPKRFGQTEWLEKLKNRVKSCEQQTKTVPQGKHIVCVLDYDKQMWEISQSHCIDLLALPFGILCYRDATKSDDLEPAYPVAKMVQRDGSPQQEIWAELKDEDILVIISYSTKGQNCEKREAENVIGEFRFALSIKENEVLRISPEEDQFWFRKPYKERVENARIIWMHNTRRPLVASYLRNLPSTRDLMLHYIGPVEKDALNPGYKYGGPINAVKLKDWLDLLLGSRIIKLFYVSPHHNDSDRREVFLVHALGGLIHDLLDGTPQLADLVWFRWSLDEEAVADMTELFYVGLLEGEPPYSTSQALLEAKKTAYTWWKSDSDRYYAWAAPMLITQRSSITSSDERPSPRPGAEHDADLEAKVRYDDCRDEIKRQQIRATEQLDKYIAQEPDCETYKDLRELKLIRKQFRTWQVELGTEDEPASPAHLREIEDLARSFVTGVLEKLSVDILAGGLSSRESLEKAFSELVKQL